MSLDRDGTPALILTLTAICNPVCNFEQRELSRFGYLFSGGGGDVRKNFCRSDGSILRHSRHTPVA